MFAFFVCLFLLLSVGYSAETTGLDQEIRDRGSTSGWINPNRGIGGGGWNNWNAGRGNGGGWVNTIFNWLQPQCYQNQRFSRSRNRCVECLPGDEAWAPECQTTTPTGCANRQYCGYGNRWSNSRCSCM